LAAKNQGNRRYWLFKTEPTTFSFDDLWNAPGRTTFWDGVRNFQARNMLRDEIKEGDLVFVYHSSADPTGIAGIAEVARSGYPDRTAFDLKNPHYDPKSNADSPTWYMVDIRAVKALPRLITLDELRKVKGLEKMVLLQRGSRLSIQPVRPEEWEIISSMA
jgi:predicted RNA-binding protein with PUA-like domain